MVKYTDHDPEKWEPEEWEYDFSWPPRINPPAHINCDGCGEMVYFDDATVVTKFNGIDDVTLHFCSVECANEWYMEHLRKQGGL